MHSTPQILDAIAAKHDGASDYRISKLLNTSTSAVAAWRKGKTALGLDFAHRAAALLDWDPAYVVACVEFERAAKDARLEATDEIKATWSKIAQAFKPAAAVILALAIFAGALPSQVVSDGMRAASRVQFIHYAKYAARWLRRMVRRNSRFWKPAVTSYNAATVAQ